MDGGRGELTVLVNDRVVAEKGESMPSVDPVVTAVRDARPHPVGV